MSVERTRSWRVSTDGTGGVAGEQGSAAPGGATSDIELSDSENSLRRVDRCRMAASLLSDG